MSTYVLMKVFESAPSRYDSAIRLLTLARLDKAYDHLASRIRKGQRVLDLGCGTGALTLRAAQRGADVKGIDVNPQMLEIAQKRADEAGLAQKVELCEMGVAELGSEESESVDVVMSGLCFSELTQNELAFALKQASRILKPGGLLLVADEVQPTSIPKRLLTWLIRFPLVVITYLIAQTTTSAVQNLPQRIAEAGFHIEFARLSQIESFIELVAKKE
jgi:ubiquinone/menaquinone biosynthesis C-methylase UbiE